MNILPKIKTILGTVWRRKIFRVPIKVLAFITFIYIGHPYVLYSQDERYFEYQFQKAIKEGKDEIFIRDLTDFDWDMLCPETAYGDGNGNGIIEGYKIKKGLEIPIFYNDGTYGLMFVKDAEIFKFIKPINPNVIESRYTRDKPPKWLSNCMTNNEARFLVTPKDEKKLHTADYILTFLNKGEKYAGHH